jgi:hypothetical protein
MWHYQYSMKRWQISLTMHTVVAQAFRPAAPGVADIMAGNRPEGLAYGTRPEGRGYGVARFSGGIVEMGSHG